MIAYELQETDQHGLDLQMFKLGCGKDGGYVTTRTGRRIALCHFDPVEWELTAPRGLKSSDLVVCCHPRLARAYLQTKGIEVVGNWDGQTYGRIRYNSERHCQVLYVWEAGQPGPDEIQI